VLLAAPHAEAVSLGLTWSAPEECPPGGFVEAEVARIVGRPWAELAAEWREARASVLPSSGGYAVRVALVTPAGAEHERRVIAASCTEAAEAVVAILTAGMAPDGSNGQHRPAPLDERPFEDADRADLPSVAAASSAGDGPSAHPWVMANLGLDVGTLAAPAPFAQLAGGVDWGRLSAIAGVGATGRVLEELEGTSAGAQMALLMGSLLGCFRLIASNPSVSGCAGVELGSLEARGIGTVESRAGRAFWSASLARVALDWNVGAVGVVSIGATAVVPFRQLRVISRPEPVHRTPSVALRPWLGLGLRFE
jgi:hypothetical protein